MLAVVAATLVERESAARLVAAIVAIRSLGVLAPLGFIAIFTAAVLALVPASAVTVLGGAIFGVAGGLIYGLVGTYLGSTLAFLIGRHAAHRPIERRLAAMPRFRAINRAVGADARRLVFLLRLSPIAPFNVLNYLFGATRIPLLDFTIGSAGMLPGTLACAYAGAVAGQALALAGRATVPATTSYYASLLAGFVATVLATVMVARTARKALRDAKLDEPL